SVLRKRDRPGWRLAVPGTSARKWMARPRIGGVFTLAARPRRPGTTRDASTATARPVRASCDAANIVSADPWCAAPRGTPPRRHADESGHRRRERGVPPRHGRRDDAIL